MKKNQIRLIVILVLAAIAGYFLLDQSSGTIRSELRNFAVEDTASIQRVFMVDKQNKSVLLERQAEGHWMVNKKHVVRPEMIDMLLKTLKRVDVREPVAKAAKDNVVSLMAVQSRKVEIYQEVYRINLFGLKWFPHEKLTKVYFVGDITQDNHGTYMLMEKSSTPFVAYMPGFRGFIQARYSVMEDDWRSHVVFNTRLPEIQSVAVEYTQEPNSSFRFERNKEGHFELFGLKNNRQYPYQDTLRVMGYLSSYGNIKFEALLNYLPATYQDSIRTLQPLHVITLTDVQGQVRKIKTFPKPPIDGTLDQVGRMLEYDLNRMYAVIEGREDFLLIQYYVFNKLLKKLPDFPAPSLRQ